MKFKGLQVKPTDLSPEHGNLPAYVLAQSLLQTELKDINMYGIFQLPAFSIDEEKQLRMSDFLQFVILSMQYINATLYGKRAGTHSAHVSIC